MEQQNTISMNFSPDILSAIASATSNANAGSSSISVATRPSATQNEDKKKRKRNRPILSCLPCHDRKQQCDRAKPCSRCVTRGTPTDCTYHEPSMQRVTRPRVDSGDESSDVPVQLERTIQTTLRNMEPGTLMGLQSLLQLVQASNIGENTGLHIGEQVAAAALGQLSQQQEGSGVSGSSMVPHIGAEPMTDILRQVGRNQTPEAELRALFPNHSIINNLLHYFFSESTIPWLWSILHKPMFDSSYVIFSGNVNHHLAFDFNALLAIVCALALQFLPQTSGNNALFLGYEPGREVLKKRLYDFSCNLVLPNNTLAPTIERIQYLAFLSIYELNEGNIASYYNATGSAIRTAQLLRLNRDGFTVPTLTHIDAEIRRVLWWTLYMLDRTQCLMLRRPYIIQDQHCDVRIPCNFDEIELKDIPHIPNKSLDNPTDSTFHILRISWAKLLGRIWDSCFATRPPSYQSVLDIEMELQQLESNLPLPFSGAPQQNINRQYLAFQNRILKLQGCHAHVIVLRPFLLMQYGTQDVDNAVGEEFKVQTIHTQAVDVCTSFCKRFIAWLLTMYEKINPSELCWAGYVARLFDVALTLAIAVVTNPRSAKNNDYEEYISMAECFLANAGSTGPIMLATKAVHCINIIRQHLRRILKPDYDPETPLQPTKEIRYYREAVPSLLDPLPCLSDLVGPLDLLIRDKEISGFTVDFPGIEVLCRSSDQDTIIGSFLDAYHLRSC
ncbi:fungal-specific transcription factor domain-containing protein [Crucibulum laeve]|uniref:Fungal-specific transcription factor domain-containing protein n=1 Tax=Crucibulum laeve TaxID=68775 RepID=A0A5C3MPU8_9AGAR|nr:fungal-specific transcription factor domain-containing protein [Crucibulum laeve]